MFSYFTNGVKDKTPESHIDLEFVINEIQSNFYKNQIIQLRKLEYGSREYNDAKVKSKLPCITPHGTFTNYLTTGNLESFSGYLYFDIDQKTIQGDVDLYRDYVLGQYGDIITVLGKSISGEGLFFYVRIFNPEILSPGNFKEVHRYFREEVFKNITLDSNAAKLTQQQIISYDPELYINDDCSVSIPIHFKKATKNRCNSKYIRRREEGYTPTCTTFIDIRVLINKLIFKTRIEYDSDEDYIVKPVEFFKTFIPRIIKDGNKHTTFRTLVNGIMFLNEDVSLKELQSYINFVNFHFTIGKPMSTREMLRTVEAEYNRYKSSGVLIIKLKIKNIHTNPALDRHTRVCVANKAIGKLKVDRSIKLIESAIEALLHEGSAITQRNVARLLEGALSVRTIKKYWHRVMSSKLNTSDDE